LTAAPRAGSAAAWAETEEWRRSTKTRKKPDACMRLLPTLANRRKNHSLQALVRQFNHRSNRRINYRRPSHLTNHSQGCFQGEIEIFGTGAVVVLFDAQTGHFPAKERL
jgi:hypothetical protein